MAGIQWIIVVPLVIAGAACLWWISKRAPKGVLLLLGIGLHVVGKIMVPMFPAVEDGHTGMRYGTLLERSMPDVCLVLQLLGTIAVIHGVILLFKKKDRTSQPEVGQVSSEAAPSASPDEPST